MPKTIEELEKLEVSAEEFLSHKKEPEGYVIYPNVDCRLFVQSYGSIFLMALKGSEENINLVFNGLYNFGATAGGSEEAPINPEFRNHSHTLASFWSSPEQMLTFFRNLYYHRNQADTAAELEIEIEDRLHVEFKGVKGGFKKDALQNHPEYIALHQSLFAEQDAYAQAQLQKLQAIGALTVVPHGREDEEEFGESLETFGQGRLSAEKPDDNFKDAVVSSAFGIAVSKDMAAVATSTESEAKE